MNDRTRVFPPPMAPHERYEELMFKPAKLLSSLLVLLALPPVESIAAGPTICAGNVPPDGMVITATGSSEACPGSCRARTAEFAQLSIMVICAGQPIPDGYEIESFTSTPACDCLGEQDNAYLIRRQSGL